MRDALLQRDHADIDIDIATPLTPPEVLSALDAAGLRAIPTGLDHGTITAIVEGRPFEITTLRRDVETDGRHAVVAFTTDWAQDAARRDFRLNALYADPDGTLHDPTGHGVEDALAGRIVFVGDAHTRIREDYLRILRFFRFLAHYGRGEPDPVALAACADETDGLSGLSVERVSKELLKLVAAPDPRSAVRYMAMSGVLALLLPETRGLEGFEGLVQIETEALHVCDATLRLAALLPDDADVVTAVARRLRLSNALRDRLVGACRGEVRIVSSLPPPEMRRAIWKLGARSFRDQALLAWAGSPGDAAAPQWLTLLTYSEAWTPPAFPVSGDDILAAGVPRGPLVGQVRRDIESWWLDHDFMDDKRAALERLKAVAQSLPR